MLKNHDSNGQVLMCSSCPKTFYTEHELNRHCEYHHEDSVSKCVVCGVEYTSKK